MGGPGSGRKGVPRKGNRFEDVFLNAYYLWYKDKAKERGIEWGLEANPGQFTIVTTQCVYCGAFPCRKVRGRGKTRGYAHGLDRIDNSRGYTEDNIVACCYTCNRAKGTLSMKDWQEWADRFVAHRPLWKEIAG